MTTIPFARVMYTMRISVLAIVNFLEYGWMNSFAEDGITARSMLYVTAVASPFLPHSANSHDFQDVDLYFLKSFYDHLHFYPSRSIEMMDFSMSRLGLNINRAMNSQGQSLLNQTKSKPRNILDLPDE